MIEVLLDSARWARKIYTNITSLWPLGQKLKGVKWPSILINFQKWKKWDSYFVEADLHALKLFSDLFYLYGFKSYDLWNFTNKTAANWHSPWLLLPWYIYHCTQIDGLSSTISNMTQSCELWPWPHRIIMGYLTLVNFWPRSHKELILESVFLAHRAESINTSIVVVHFLLYRSQNLGYGILKSGRGKVLWVFSCRVWSIVSTY
jgi:hypothetical protein